MKSTLDSLKSVFNEFRRKPSLGATEVRLLSQDKNVQKRWKVDSQAKHKFDFQGLFFWREEDPRRRNNFTLGLHAGNVGPCGAQVKKSRERIKNDERQKQKCNLGPSAPF